MLSNALGRLLSEDNDLEDASLLPYLIDSLRELADVRQREGKWDESHSYLQTALQALEDADLPDAATRRRAILERMAWGLFRKGDLEEARIVARAGVEALDEDALTDAVTGANLYNTLGGIAWQQGNHADAISYVERSLELYRKVGYSWGVANCHTNLGVLHYTLGNWTEAVRNLDAAGLHRDAVGDLQNMALNLNNLGFIRIAMGDFAQAEKDLCRSLEIRIQLGDTWGQVRTRINLVHLALATGDLEKGKAWLAPALTQVEDTGNEMLEIPVRTAFAQLLEQEGKLEASLAEIHRALALLAANPDAETAAECYRTLGVLQMENGDYVQAELSLRRSIVLAEERNEPYSGALARLQLARLYIHQMQSDLAAQTEWRLKAQEALRTAFDTLEQLGAGYGLQQARVLRQVLQRAVAADMATLQSRTPLPDSPSMLPQVPEGERLPVVLLWVCFDLTQAPDDEEAFAFLAQVAPTVQALARENGARLLRRADGFLLVFGAPMAHENDALRAARTAWLLQEHFNRLEHQERIHAMPEATHPFHMALVSGLVVAGEIGPEEHREFTVHGDAVDEVLALGKRTPPGQIWVSESVYNATRTRAEYVPQDAAGDEGEVWELKSVSQLETPGPRMNGQRVQLIGRRVALKSLLGMAESNQHGRGGIVWIEGEAGIGKSRLMDEFGLRMRKEGRRVAWGQCSPHTQTRPFSLFTSFLYNVFQIQPGQTADTVRGQLRSALQPMPTAVQAVGPFLEILLGVQAPGAVVHIANLEPDQLRQQLFVALRTLLRGMTAQQPLVLMLDDLHWIDPMSAHLLVFLLAMIEKEPILFVCAQRPEATETSAWILDQANKLYGENVLQLSLTRLSRVESQDLLAALLGGDEIDPALERIILERCEGSPFYIQEFVRMLIERGLLQHVDGQWVVPEDVDVAQTPLPVSLEGLIRSRLNALPGPYRQILQCACVIGRPFTRRLMASITNQPDLTEILSALVRREILHFSTDTQQWQVSHPLIEEVVYNSLLRPQREAWHLRIADALNRRSAETGDDAVEEQAHHYMKANRPLQALPYLVLAGEKAAARFANQEARNDLEQAWQLVHSYPNQPARLVWRIAVALGDVLQRTGDYSLAVEVLNRGLVQCQEAGLPEYFIAGVHRRLGDTAQKQGDLEAATGYLEQALRWVQMSQSRAAHAEQARIDLSLAWGYFLQGDLDRAEETCLRGRAEAQAIGNLAEVARAENILGGIYYQQGNLDKAQEHTMRAMTLREQIGFSWGVAATASNLGILAHMAGQWRNARRYFERSLALREEFGDVEGVVIVLNNLAWLLKDQGDLEQAEAYYRQSLHLANRIQGQYHMVTAKIGLSQVLLLKGDFPGAHTLNEQAQQDAAGIGAHDLLAESHRVEAELLLAEGKPAAARNWAQRSLALTREMGNRNLECSAWCAVAACALAQEDWAGAEAAVARARVAVEAAENPLEKGRVALLTARTIMHDKIPGSEIPPDALEQLHEARRIFSDLGATRDLAQVDALLPLRIRAQELFRRLQAAE